ncbi:MAG TPA: hypothetical protein VJ124_12225 [Pyrinomonadaceae bacterium]|nr:hypothetical protein [Pyrinomonadaceae bacterium]
MIVSRKSNQSLIVKTIVLSGLLSQSASCGKLKTTEVSQPEVITSNTPPFSTKEPGRYQALRVITTSETSGGTTVTTTTRVSRDGANRRQERLLDNGETIVYLETPGGRYLLLPSLRIFAAVTGPGAEQTEAGEDLSPEKVLNEDPFHARYQRLGNESLLGRSTVKYKVTVERGAETVIWIDESIGMPVRSETSYSDAQHSAKTTMELKDIRLEVDPELFLLPPDYRKATSAEEFEKLRIGRPHQK